MDVNADPTAPDPMFYRLVVNTWLRELREEKGLTQEEVASANHLGPTVLSDYERMRSSPSVATVEKLFRFYDVDEERLATAKVFAKEALRRKSRSKDPAIPEWFGLYQRLEQHMTELNTFTLTLVPGLFQIRAYVQALLRAGVSTTAADLEHLVDVRMARQTVLDKPDLTISAVIKETVLLTPVGGPDVMRDQIDHLIALAERPNIKLRVLPNRIGAHPSLGSEFSILRFPIPFAVAYSEVMNAAVYIKTPAGIALHDAAYRDLGMNALSKDSSVALMKEIRDNYDR